MRVTQNAYFSLITHTKQLLLVTFCDTTPGIGASVWTHVHGWTEGQIDVEVEIVIKINLQKKLFMHKRLASFLG